MTTDLFLRCLCLEDDQAKLTALESCSPNDWESILTQARRHGLTPLLYWKLQALPGDLAIPGHVRQEMHTSLLASAGRNLRLFHQLGRVLGAFQQAGIPVIALKGVHLAALVYEDVSLRTMGDADLLVRIDDLGPAARLLQLQGYEPFRRFSLENDWDQLQHLPPYLKPGETSIELHWTLANPPGPLLIDLQGLWRRARAASIDGSGILVLSPEDLLIHLCLHLFKDDFRPGLRAIYDLLAVLVRHRQEIDWEKLQELAFQSRGAKSLYLGLRLAVLLLGAPVPEDKMAALYPADFTPQIESLARRRVLEPGGPALQPDLARLWGATPLKTRASAFLRALFPYPEYVQRRYALPAGSPLTLLYYPVRLKDLFVQYGGQLWGLLRRDPNTLAQSRQQNALHDWWMAG